MQIYEKCWTFQTSLCQALDRTIGGCDRLRSTCQALVVQAFANELQLFDLALRLRQFQILGSTGYGLGFITSRCS